MNNNIIGFTSIKDFVITVFGLKAFKINLCMAFLFGLSTFITNWIYNAPAVYFMVILLIIDVITGVIKSIKKKTFSSSRLPRAFVSLVIYCVLLFIATQASIHSTYFSFLPGAMYGGIISTLIVSILENLQQAGFIDQNIYSLIDKIKKK